jgi:hypothetical protein
MFIGNDSRSDRNQSNEENKPTNEITKEAHHSFHVAEKVPHFKKKTEVSLQPATCPYSESQKYSHILNLSLF